MNWKNYILHIMLLLLFSLSNTYGQNFNMTNGSITTCSGTFYDNGGTGDYSNNQNLTYTICPDISNADISIFFDDIIIRPPDLLSVYDGNSTAGNLIGSYNGRNVTNITLTATNDGCLTFVFVSNGNNTRSGWDGDISCITNSPSISIDDVTENEDAGTIDFTVSHTGSTTAASFDIDYTTANGTTDAADFNGLTSGTITFTGTTLSDQTISIPITNDNVAETLETFLVNLSNSSDPSVTFDDNQGQGTINASDPVSIEIDDITINEGDGTATFTVSSSGGVVTGGFTVVYTTADGTADTPDDYAGTTGSPVITFAGTLNETEEIDISIVDDSDVEPDHNFFVNLGTISNSLVSASDAQGEATIEDNEAGISINDVSENENAGTITFTVTHSGGNVPGGFTVNYSTADSSATEPDDYLSASSSVAFSGTPGTQSIVITLVDDTDIEGDETFFVNLTSTSNSLAIVSDSQGEGTITDDETPIKIDDADDDICSGIFTDTGSFDGEYENTDNETIVLCSDTPGADLIVDFTTFDVEDGFDFLRIYDGDDNTAPLIGIFDNGNVPSKIVSTNGLGCLTFNFTSDGSVTLDGWTADISCATDYVTVNSPTISEDGGTLFFTATLATNVPGGFTIDYTTADGTALAGSDYTTTAGTLTFSGNAGEMVTIPVGVPIIDNDWAESNEEFFLNLFNPSNPLIGSFPGTGTITDDAGDTAIPSNVPLTLFDEFNGYYDYALTGGTFRDDDSDTCSIVGSSSNTLTTSVPNTGVIEKAYLLWAHSGVNFDDVVTFENQTVVADIVNEATFGTDLIYYGMVSDVTTVLQDLIDTNVITDLSTNVFDVTDLYIDNTNDNEFYCGGNTTLGGWSLFIFYEELSLPAVSINFYNGFDGQQNTTQTYPLSGFYAIGATGSKTSILSWEGDPGSDGLDTIELTTSVGTTILDGDGDNDSGVLNNPFNSTIFDDTVIPIINDTDGRGIDLDTYDISSLIAPGESSASTEVTTGGDFVILNSVLIKVPSNLITGTVFEDVNYPGGVGRDLATSSGIGIAGATVELYNSSGNLEDSDVTNINGVYNLGGMANGDYTLRVVSNTVKSNRINGSTCTTCLPIQTFKSGYTANDVDLFPNEIGGQFPSGEDAPAATSIGDPLSAAAQTISAISIDSEGAVGVDFGFNFSTIVNTNESGQGSLEQFIINSNELDETGLNIEANSIFDPAASEDVSIFMIPSTSDPLGRTADSRFNGSGYFDILISNSAELSSITADNTHIDGRTQTAYSGDTNAGVVGSGGTSVGTSGTTLPNYNQPEIQIRQNNGVDNYVLEIQADNTVIRNTAIYANVDAGIQITSGSGTITQNLIGVNANGIFTQNIDYGIQVNGGTVLIDSNYIADTTDAGIFINGGTSSTIQGNHITTNGDVDCNPNITLTNGTGIEIQNNLIENASGYGINNNIDGVIITDNTITTSGQDLVDCTNTAGINLNSTNANINNNIIHTNAGAGIILTGGAGNLISQNSIYANGTLAPALGIDINNDGVSINDNGDGDGGPNDTLNFPVFESVTIKGNQLKVIGWSRPGAIIELFVTDINEGTATVGDNQFGASINQDYGEGQIYIGTITEGINDNDNTSSLYNDIDGNTDNTNKFNITINLASAIPTKTTITATATLANSSSEFGSIYIVRSGTVITNRRITYRVKK